MNILMFDMIGSRSELAKLAEKLLFRTLNFVKSLVYKKILFYFRKPIIYKGYQKHLNLLKEGSKFKGDGGQMPAVRGWRKTGVLNEEGELNATDHIS